MPKKHSKKIKQSSLLHPLIVLAVVTIGVMLWYSLKPRPTPIGINLVGEENGTVTFTLSPGEVTLEPNTETTLTLTLTVAEGSHATGAQIDLMYDATKVGIPIVTLGDFMPNVLSSVKTDGGTISFVVGAAPSSGGKTGTGTLATIKLTPPVAGTSTLTFSEMNAATTIESQTNMIKSASDVTITVVAAQASPSSSAQSSPSPSPSASTQSSPSPSPSPSAPVNPARPAKPTGLRSNCFDGGNKITLRWDAVSGATSYKLRLDQKDGNGDKSIDNITKTEYDLSIIPDQKYSWWVHSSKDGQDSEEAKINEVVCAKSSAATSPSPSPTARPSVKPTLKPTVKPTAKPSIKPSSRPSPTTVFTIPSPGSNGSLNDIFTDKDALSSPSPTAKPSFFQMVVQGWQAIFASLAEIFK